MSIILFDEKKNCSGCQACVNICPKQTIKVEPDENGFLYPRIETANCIECGLCNKVCAFQADDDSRKEPLAAYAAVVNDEELLKHSASGGVFAAVARHILKEGGIVVGCALEPEGDVLRPCHVVIESEDDLRKLQGSKYVKSDMGHIYMDIHKALAKKRKVLFCGVPCQVDAVNRFFSKAQKENLFTCDIICHGNPSIQMFQDYLQVLSNKEGKPIVDFNFRDKQYSWGHTASVTYQNEDGTTKTEKVPSHRSSYYKNFLNGDIYQDACYNCKYSGIRRTGDLTLGDFWGIGIEYPEYVKDTFKEEKGVSCVLANSQKGVELLEEMNDQELILKPADLDKIVKYQGNLTNPSQLHPAREEVLEAYRTQGYPALDEAFNQSLGAKAMVRDVWYAMPPKVKNMVKKAARRTKAH